MEKIAPVVRTLTFQINHLAKGIVNGKVFDCPSDWRLIKSLPASIRKLINFRKEVQALREWMGEGRKTRIFELITGERKRGNLSLALPRAASPNHPVSKKLRSVFEVKWVKGAIGIPLAGTTLLGTFFSPTLALGTSSEQPDTELVSLNVEEGGDQSVEFVTEQAIKLPVDEVNISQGYHQWHPAVDLRADWGSPVYAMENGKVEEINYWRWGYGTHVVIKHGNGRKSLYAHLSRVDVAKGDGVKGGEKVGEVGSSGRSTGSHLHLEIIENGIYMNPVWVLEIW
jgi:murein DD-endopeptidase MepM/ murein hydrolase activator NlpD